MGKSAIDGSTILVTGASSGIGMEIARLLAPRAKALVLVARRVDRLEELKRSMLEARPVLRVETIPCDLSSREDVAKLIAEVRTRALDVDVLVNNAGVGMMGMFETADTTKTAFMIDLNVTSLTLLTLAFLPAMVERGRGGIMNVSSGFGLATLGAKVPGFVKITAEHCARAAIRGFERNRAIVVPGLLLKIAMMVNAFSPRFMRRVFAGLIGRHARRKQLAAPVL